MRFPFQSLALSVVLLSTTFCSKDNALPTPSADGQAVSSNLAPSYNPNSLLPLGFNPQICDVDTTGTSSYLMNEARNNAYYWNGSQLSDAQFVSLKSSISSSSDFTLDANGHVASNVAYSSRLNGFTDAVNEQLDEYNYYVYWASLQGSDVQNTTDIKGIIEEQFELTIPVQPEEMSTLSQIDKDRIGVITGAARAQLGRSMSLFSALYQCEPASRLANAASTTASDAANGKDNLADTGIKKVGSFKAFLALRKAGKIRDFSNDAGYLAQRGFWSKLKSAAHKLVTAVVFTAVGATIGFAQGFVFGGAGSVPGAFIGGAVGFLESFRNIRNNRCIFGSCQ